MNLETPRQRIVLGVTVASVVAGVIGGYFLAHITMAGSTDMPQMEMKGSADMSGMAQGHGESPAAVAIPAVTRQLIGVRSTSAAYGPLEQNIRAVGLVDYDERGLTKVNLKVSGWVKQVFVNSIGQPVRKGERLFTLYAPDLLATQDEHLVALKMQAQLAESPLADAKAGAVALVVSTRERLRLWDLTNEQIAALERRGTAEPILTVYARSSGVVLKREALPGNFVEPGTTLYELADLSTVWIYADIYESEIAAVKLHQSAAITFDAYPGETFKGHVAYVYPSLNTEARTVRVRLELPNPGLRLKPGMYGNVTLHTSANRTLVIPREAVLETGLRQLVFMDRGQGRYELAPVKLGRRSQDSVEVLEGLKEGDRVVTSANFLLDAESKLTSAGSMQAMMGQIGMGDWQMRGAHEGKMEGMAGMKGMEPAPAIVVAETRQVDGLSLSLSTVPEKPKAGEVVLRLRVVNQAGKPMTNAQVLFVYTMPMPGMADSKVMARHTKDGLYEGKAVFGMGGTWVVTANVTLPEKPPVTEKFQFSVTGGGM